MTRNKPLLSTAAAAQRLADLGMPTSEETVREWARSGLVPAVRTPGGRYKFRTEDIDALVEAPAAPNPERRAS